MADRNLSRAHVGLALASALVVLLASVAAISRLGDSDDEGVSTGASGSTSSTAGAESAAPGSGPATGASDGSSGVPSGAPGGVEQAPGAADALAAAAGVKSQSKTRDSNALQGSRSASTDRPGSEAENVPAAPAGAGSARSGDAAGGSADSSAGGSRSGGQGGPQTEPQPSQDRPEQKPLLTASASVGQGAQGGVVGFTLDGGSPELDLTVGTDQVVGNHPPSQGTGINFGGTFLNPPPTVPLPPG